VPLDPDQQAGHAAAGHARQGRPRALLGLRRVNFKVFTFCLAAGLSGIGGAMFTLQVGFMSPSFVGIVPSIEMVIFCAVGGRMSLVGAVYGALLVNAGKTCFSESFPDLWLFLMAACSSA
jgi:urea transport system permease protein